MGEVSHKNSLPKIEMKTTFIKKAAVVALGLGFAALVSASEKIVIKGSDTLGAKLVPQLAEEFKAIKAKEGVEVTFEIAAEGSSTGVAAIIDSTADLGMSSRDAKKTEISKALLKGVKMTPLVVGMDGIAVIVNEKNPMSDINARDVEKIFTGDVESWSSINGRQGTISIYTRNTSSGTYASFQEMALQKRDYAPSSQKMAGNEQIASEVSKNENGIGYVGLAYLGAPGIKVLTVEGVTPEAPEYKFARPLYYYYDSGKDMRPIVKEFVDFTFSPAGQAIVKKVHFIPVK